MEKKITKREQYNTLLTYAEVQANPSMVDFINHELELLDRKNSGERKPTAAQIENETLKTDILNEMEVNRLYSLSEMIKEFECCAGRSTQKLSPLMTQLAKAGEVEKVVDKRKTFYRLAMVGA